MRTRDTVRMCVHRIRHMCSHTYFCVYVGCSIRAHGYRAIVTSIGRIRREEIRPRDSDKKLSVPQRGEKKKNWKIFCTRSLIIKKFLFFSLTGRVGTAPIGTDKKPYETRTDGAIVIRSLCTPEHGIIIYILYIRRPPVPDTAAAPRRFPGPCVHCVRCYPVWRVQCYTLRAHTMRRHYLLTASRISTVDDVKCVHRGAGIVYNTQSVDGGWRVWKGGKYRDGIAQRPLCRSGVNTGGYKRFAPPPREKLLINLLYLFVRTFT